MLMRSALGSFQLCSQKYVHNLITFPGLPCYHPGPTAISSLDNGDSLLTCLPISLLALFPSFPNTAIRLILLTCESDGLPTPVASHLVRAVRADTY